jgi:hypothetical protein
MAGKAQALPKPAAHTYMKWSSIMTANANIITAISTIFGFIFGPFAGAS